jgi:hypothetical protein
MKKVLIVVVFVLTAGTVFAQSDLPTEAEAARVIEGYWRCIGNGDFEGIKNYGTDEMVKISKDLYEAITDNDKQELKLFKILKMTTIEN